ncbi:MAG: hypothetical protein GY816_07875 [Cytophagales bacterium]|nr:hypothetical protein [Cytophagales bacterium]
MGCRKLSYYEGEGAKENCSVFLGKHLEKKGQPLKKRVEYHPFGSTAYRSENTTGDISLKRYRYVGKERDEETGLYYYGARYYAAWLARFVSVDPLKDDYPYYTSYQYAGNKPITFIDLDGLEPATPPIMDVSSGNKMLDSHTIGTGQLEKNPKTKKEEKPQITPIEIKPFDYSKQPNIVPQIIGYKSGDPNNPFVNDEFTIEFKNYFIVEPTESREKALYAKAQRVKNLENINSIKLPGVKGTMETAQNAIKLIKFAFKLRANNERGEVLNEGVEINKIHLFRKRQGFQMEDRTEFLMLHLRNISKMNEAGIFNKINDGEKLDISEQISLTNFIAQSVMDPEAIDLASQGSSELKPFFDLYLFEYKADNSRGSREYNQSTTDGTYIQGNVSDHRKYEHDEQIKHRN